MVATRRLGVVDQNVERDPTAIPWFAVPGATSEAEIVPSALRKCSCVELRSRITIRAMSLRSGASLSLSVDR
jgi:hypothetical protein